MATDYEERFDDIHNNYIKTKPSWLKQFKGESPKDLKEWLLDEFDRNNNFSDNFAARLSKTSSAARKMGILERQAVEIELARPLSQRRPDEAKTAKDTRKINKKTLRAWRQNPGRFDLQGIDTQTKTLLAREVSRKINAKRNAGFKVSRRGGIPAYRDTRTQRFRNLLNGQFIK